MGSPGDFDARRALLLRAAETFPFDDRFQKAAERLDFYVPLQLDPRTGMADAERALASDPYAPDMLNGLLFFALRANDMPVAAYAFKILRETEPGFLPPYLQQAAP